MIRNPYDKAVSEFFFRRGRQVAGTPLAFEQWLQDPGPTIDRDKYVIDGQFCLDDVVRYEALPHELERICARLGVPWAPQNLRSFKAGIRPRGLILSEFFTRTARALVEQAYSFELDHFQYAFPMEQAEA